MSERKSIICFLLCYIVWVLGQHHSVRAARGMRGALGVHAVIRKITQEERQLDQLKKKIMIQLNLTDSSSHGSSISRSQPASKEDSPAEYTVISNVSGPSNVPKAREDRAILAMNFHPYIKKLVLDDRNKVSNTSENIFILGTKGTSDTGDDVLFDFSRSDKYWHVDPDQGVPRVTSARLFLFLRYKKKVRGRKNAPQRVQINLSRVGISTGREERDEQHPLEDESPSVKTSLRTSLRHSRWQQLIVPATQIQSALLGKDEPFILRITCSHCGTDVQPVLAVPSTCKQVSQDQQADKQSAKRCRTNALNKRRPFLWIQVAKDRN